MRRGTAVLLVTGVASLGAASTAAAQTPGGDCGCTPQLPDLSPVTQAVTSLANTVTNTVASLAGIAQSSVPSPSVPELPTPSVPDPSTIVPAVDPGAAVPAVDPNVAIPAVNADVAVPSAPSCGCSASVLPDVSGVLSTVTGLVSGVTDTVGNVLHGVQQSAPAAPSPPAAAQASSAPDCGCPTSLLPDLSAVTNVVNTVTNTVGSLTGSLAGLVPSGGQGSSTAGHGLLDLSGLTQSLTGGLGGLLGHGSSGSGGLRGLPLPLGLAL
jgi:hypothetical protein